MKILVPVERAVDDNIKVRVKADGTRVDTANVKMSMYPLIFRIAFSASETRSVGSSPSLASPATRPRIVRSERAVVHA
jgi:electron transfer flavoprotein beta subunit